MPSPLEIAESYYARRVREATGRNDGVDVERFLDGERGLNWCAAFVLTCFSEAGTPLPGNKWLNRAVSHLESSLSLAGADVPLDDVQTGDIVTFDRVGGTGHVGIVSVVGEHTFHAIEGNVRNAIQRVRHRRDDPQWRGCFRWPAPARLPAPMGRHGGEQ